MPPEDKPPGAAGRPKGKRCPICGKPAQKATRPFCSKRCRDVDLHRWLSGAYVVPGSDDEEEGKD